MIHAAGTRVRRLFLISAGVATALGCEPNGDAPTARTVSQDSAGVIVARSAAQDAPFPGTVTLERYLDPPESGFFEVGHALAADSSGHLFVLDKGNHRLLVFDAAGAFQMAMGRRGGGPGEMERPQALVVSGGGVAYVHDMARRGFIRFTRDGQPLDGTLAAQHFFGGEDVHVHEGMITHVRGARAESGDQLLQLVSYAGSEQPRILAVRTRLEGKNVTFPGCPLTMGAMEPFLGPKIAWSAHGAHVAINPVDEYRIEVYRADTLSLIIERPLAGVPVTPELAAMAAVNEFGAEGFVLTYPTGRCTIDPKDMVAARGFAPSTAVVRRMAMAPGGEVWVQRLTVEGQEPIDVFDGAGRYLGTLPTGTVFPDAFLGDSRYASAVRDTLDEERVAVFMLERTGG
ncbi:MAG: 6-bladed beta-propeller [Gemmatimonadota bacterium]